MSNEYDRPLTQKELLSGAKQIDDNIGQSDLKQAERALSKITKKPSKTKK